MTEVIKKLLADRRAKREYPAIIALAEAYASEYLKPREDRLPLNADNAWIAVRSGYIQGATEDTGEAYPLLLAINRAIEALDRINDRETSDGRVSFSADDLRDISMACLADIKKILSLGEK